MKRRPAMGHRQWSTSPFDSSQSYCAGVVDRLRQLGVPRVFGVNFGAAAQRWDDKGAKPLYANKRAEMWGA